MNRHLLKSLWILSILACAGCTLKEAADCVKGQTECKPASDGKGISNVCTDDGIFEMNTICMLGCDNNKCRSMNVCDKNEEICRGVGDGLALVWTCSDHHTKITPCTGECNGNKCDNGDAQGMCMGTEQPFCAQTVAVWCESNHWQAKNCEEAGEVCVDGQCKSESSEPDDHVGDDTGGTGDDTGGTGDDTGGTGDDTGGTGDDTGGTGDDTGDDTGGTGEDTCTADVVDPTAKSSEITDTVFHIYTGKGFLDYQSLTKDERKVLTQIVIHGEINLNHAQKTVMSEDESSCAWSDWKPLEVPNKIQITGADNAKIKYETCKMRCTLPGPLFKEIYDGAIINLNLDYDYDGSDGIVVSEIYDTEIENVQYSGDVHGGRGFFGFIANAKRSAIKSVKLNYGNLYGTSGDFGGLIGAVEAAVDISDVHIKIKQVIAEREFGGIIGSVYDNNSVYDIGISHSSVIIDSAEKHEWQLSFGGILAYNQSDYKFTISDVYIQLGKVSAAGEYISSAGIGCSFFNPEYQLSNIMVRLTDESVFTLAGIMGYYQGLPGSVDIKDSVVISEADLMGVVGKGGVQPKLNRVVMVSPNSECDHMIYTQMTNESVIWDASMVKDSYYYDDNKCDKTSEGFKKYTTSQDTNDMVTLYKSYSADVDWQVKNLKVGGKTLPVPVFTAAGLLPE